MTSRKLNFFPGPGALPQQVLETAQAELLDFADSGMSVMEHSHRGPEYDAVHNEAARLLRELLHIPDSHDVLFMQGGARVQFALVPMNFLPAGKRADYVNTGIWGVQALAEAQLLGSAREVLSTKNADGIYTRVPEPAEVNADPDAAYVHITSNNTLYGTQYQSFPDSGDVPLIADMSSDLCWRPFDVSRFGLIYASAQKNLGPAGVTVVIARRDLIAAGAETIPKIFRYRTVSEANSLQNTPPTFAIYLVSKVLRWLVEQGGLAAMEQRNRAKAAAVYGVVDAHQDFYRSAVEASSRSCMNATFNLPTVELEQAFLEGAVAENMVGLKGHRVTGGIRISMYNAMGPEEVTPLVDYMKVFASQHGA